MVTLGCMCMYLGAKGRNEQRKDCDMTHLDAEYSAFCSQRALHKLLVMAANLIMAYVL